MQDDHALVTRAQRGDAQAFAILYDRHLDAVYRYMILRVATQEQAEDLTEDVFLRAWQALGSYSPSQPFLHWLYRIAHNRVIDEHRRKVHHNTSIDALEDAGYQLPDREPTPLQTVLAQEEVQALRTALATMTPEEQTLLTLRFAEDMPFHGVAAILHKSEGACRVLQHRALHKLAQRLQPSSQTG